MSCFSTTVKEATEKFVTASLTAGGQADQYMHPLVDPNGQPLHATVSWFGPATASCVLMIISGTHGAEGWAGSAIQIDSLQRGAFQDLPPDTAVMMIHLINPWGCAWGRRENEDNADLFRDLIYYQPSLYSDDRQFTDEIAELMTLKSYSDKHWKASKTAIKHATEQMGELTLINILRAGQFHYPEATSYNGGGISWSFQFYKNAVKRYLTHAKQVFCVDIHTAFGDYGDGILIPYYQPDGLEREKFEYLKQTYGVEKLYVGGFDPSIPSHPRMPYEIATDFIPELSMIATGLEFGTYEWTDGLNLIKYMNYLFTKGDPLNPERPDLVDQYNKLCYPDKDDWREMVITRSREVINQTLAGSQTWSEAQ